MEKLTNGVDALVTGTKKLDDGALKLSAGAEKLMEGTEVLKTGAGKLYDGTQALKQGVGQLTKGTGELQKGADALYAGAGELKNGADQLSAGLSQLSKSSGAVNACLLYTSVIGCVTILPSLILTFDKVIERTRHKSIIPDMKKTASFVVKKSPIFLAVFVITLGPAIYGYNNTNIYYDMGGALPKDMNFVISNEKLMDEFDMAATHMILVDRTLNRDDVRQMTERLEGVDGIKTALSLDSVIGKTIPEEILPDEAVSTLKSGKYQLMLAMSEYRTASKEVNRQLTAMNDIVKDYDKEGMIIGEAACTKDLMKTTDRDFKLVSAVSIVLIFLIIALVLKSGSLPVILVMTIYFAIFINLGIPYYTGTWLPFIAPICLTTIQLGSTVDYAILMTTRYKRERISGADRDTAEMCIRDRRSGKAGVSSRSVGL